MSSLITPKEVVMIAFSTTESVTPAAIIESKIIAAEEKYLRPVLGELVDALKNGKYPELLETYIKPALAYYVRYGVIPDLSLKLNNRGTQVPYTGNSNAATDKQRSELRMQALDDAVALMSKALRYIAQGDFPEYNSKKNIQDRVIFNGGIIMVRK